MLLGGELGGEESADDVGCDLRSDDPGADAEHVDVVVDDALAGDVGVGGDGGADAVDLVGGDAGARPGAADEDDTFGPAIEDELHRLAGDVGEIDRLGRFGAERDHLVGVLGEEVADEALDRKAGVIGGEADGAAARNDHAIGVAGFDMQHGFLLKWWKERRCGAHGQAESGRHPRRDAGRMRQWVMW